MTSDNNRTALDKDSVIYALTHLQSCWPNPDASGFRIDYMHERLDSWLQHKILSSELDAVHPEMSEFLCKLFGEDCRIPGSGKAKIANAVGAYVSGKAICLETSSETPHTHPFISRIHWLSSLPNDGGFSINGDFFSVSSISDTGMPRVDISQKHELVITSEQLDAIYSDGSKHVLMLEALGYKPYTIRKMLENELNTPLVPSKMSNDITFD